MNELDVITQGIRAFRDARAWKKFSNPKNPACSISIESTELLEHFQWKTPEESMIHSVAKRDALSEEIADAGIYLLALADSLGIDPLNALERKLAINEAKYPVGKSKGSAANYNAL